jgi:hypothetical protein
LTDAIPTDPVITDPYRAEAEAGAEAGVEAKAKAEAETKRKNVTFSDEAGGRRRM